MTHRSRAAPHCTLAIRHSCQSKWLPLLSPSPLKWTGSRRPDCRLVLPLRSGKQVKVAQQVERAHSQGLCRSDQRIMSALRLRRRSDFSRVPTHLFTADAEEGVRSRDDLTDVAKIR